MRRLLIEGALWVSLLAGVAGLGRAVSVPIAVAPAARPSPARMALQSSAPYAADSLSRGIVARDPFRIGRRPSMTPYDPSPGSAQGPLTASPQRPQLVLRGILLGDTARALIEGLPGTGGARLVRTGDVIAGFRIAGITRTQARVAGPDTTWTLTLRRPE